MISFESSKLIAAEDETYCELIFLNISFHLDTNIFRALPAKRCGIPTQMFQKTVCIWISGHRRRLAFDMNAYMKMAMASMGTEIIMKALTIITNTTLKACRCSCGFTAEATWGDYFLIANSLNFIFWFKQNSDLSFWRAMYDVLIPIIICLFSQWIINPWHLQCENTVGCWKRHCCFDAVSCRRLRISVPGPVLTGSWRRCPR